MTWLEELFGCTKPIVAMAHLPPLPGTPLYDETTGMQGILDSVATDVEKLLSAGVDGIMFCNEGDRPYALKADFEAIAVMTAIIVHLAPQDRPFGVDFLWDPRAPIAIAKATGAHFVREVFTGTYESDMGLWSPDAAAMLRYRRAIDARDVRLLFNIVPEAAAYVGERDVGDIARSTVFNTQPDALCVSGLTAGAETSSQTLQLVKEAVPDTIVFANTGVRLSNVEEQLAIADGAVVGTAFKEDGHIWNPVDPQRVKAFMGVVKGLR